MKLHTGRSRNDQIVTDMRLWLIKNLNQLELNLKLLQAQFIKRAKEEIEILMPGYTHLQRAQPIRFIMLIITLIISIIILININRWSHLLMSYVSSLDRDFDRIQQLKNRVNVCPLGW